MKKIILDCDTGEDDALAILVALANKLPIDYIVTSFGNTSLKNSTANTANILGLANNDKIKVIPFSSASLQPHKLEPAVSAASFIGQDGLCNTSIPKTNFNNVMNLPPQKVSQYLINVLKKQKSTDYIITGPCTNFAKICLELGDELKKYVHAIYIMGGAVYAGGNSGPIDTQTGQQIAEFNFYCDPYAADIVLKSGLPIHLITWDTTKTIVIPYPAIQNFEGIQQSGKFVVAMMQNFFKYYGLDQKRGFELNDPITVLTQMGFAGGYQKKKIKVLTTKKHYGKVVATEDGYPIFYFAATKHEIKKMTQKILMDIGITTRRK